MLKESCTVEDQAGSLDSSWSFNTGCIAEFGAIMNKTVYTFLELIFYACKNFVPQDYALNNRFGHSDKVLLGCKKQGFLQLFLN